jgi:hypothetical protein
MNNKKEIWKDREKRKRAGTLIQDLEFLSFE